MAGRTPDFEPHDGLDPLASRHVDIEAIPWRETRPGMDMKVPEKDDEGVRAAGGFAWRPPGGRHEARAPNGARFLVLLQSSARSVDGFRLLPSYDD